MKYSSSDEVLLLLCDGVYMNFMLTVMDLQHFSSNLPSPLDLPEDAVIVDEDAITIPLECISNPQGTSIM